MSDISIILWPRTLREMFICLISWTIAGVVVYALFYVFWYIRGLI